MVGSLLNGSTMSFHETAPFPTSLVPPSHCLPHSLVMVTSPQMMRWRPMPRQEVANIKTLNQVQSQPLSCTCRFLCKEEEHLLLGLLELCLLLFGSTQTCACPEDTKAEIPLATMKKEELQWMSQWSEDEELIASYSGLLASPSAFGFQGGASKTVILLGFGLFMLAALIGGVSFNRKVFACQKNMLSMRILQPSYSRVKRGHPVQEESPPHFVSLTLFMRMCRSQIRTSSCRVPAARLTSCSGFREQADLANAS